MTFIDMVFMDRPFRGGSRSNSPTPNRPRTVVMDTLSTDSCYRSNGMRNSHTFDDFIMLDTGNNVKVTVPRKLSEQPPPRRKSNNAPLIWVSISQNLAY